MIAIGVPHETDGMNFKVSPEISTTFLDVCAVLTMFLLVAS